MFGTLKVKIGGLRREFAIFRRREVANPVNTSAWLGTNVNSLEPDRCSRRSERLCERVKLTLAGRDQLAQIPVYQRSPSV
jgi:hypothetical protein